MRDIAKIGDTTVKIISEAEREIKDQTGEDVVLIAYNGSEES